jgi:hypothetical protein
MTGLTADPIRDSRGNAVDPKADALVRVARTVVCPKTRRRSCS